ncbi:hypothetical protein BC829DRAFT_468997 [Chytridium lagenaria]|nr:hypothetical protein BC829DRAFT_468997 [Chytridium lagenaria]
MADTKESTPVYVGSIDQGTSSTRFIVFDSNGTIVAVHQEEFPQIMKHPGWCEHDPLVILATVENCVNEVTKDMMARGLDVSAIKGVGVTNQRETTVVWDAATGEPVANAIVWLDARTKPTVEALIAKTSTQKPDEFQAICGLPITTYFSAVKLNWLLAHEPLVNKTRDEGRLMFGTIDSWIIYVCPCLIAVDWGCEGGVHVTDVTNASRTMLMNLMTLKWDEQLIRFFGAEKVRLPEIRSSSEVYGQFSNGPLVGTPISGCLGDQQAALVGQRCVHPGEVKNTYGTGCFMLFNTGVEAIISKSGLLTTVAYKLGKDEPVAYALEGSIAIAGAAVKWLRDGMGIIKDAKERYWGVYFVPAFSGLYAPHWRSDARGCIVGLTHYATKAHICRATLEAVCWQSKELLKVDGGLTNSDLCMQLQADIVGIPVERPAMRETTALGAAIAAGLAVGVWPSIEAFRPAEIDEEERETRFAQWKKAVERSLNWA